MYAIQSGTTELVRVEYDRVVNDPIRRRDEHFSDCFLVCDPSREWILTEYGGTFHNHINNDNRVFHVKLEYGESVGGIPIANKISRTSTSPDDPDSTSVGVTTIEVTSHDVPEEEFFLSYYGLPEPNFGRGRFWGWVWYLIAGIVCLVVARVIMKRRRDIG